MQRLKALLSDFDGTLATDDKRISPVDRAAVERLVKNGFKFALVTGRMTASARRALANFPFYELIAAYNGAEIVDKNGEILSEKYLSNKDGEELAAFAEERGINCHVYSDKVITPEILPLTKLYAKACDCKVERTGIKTSEFVRENKFSSPKLMFLDEKDKLDEFLPEIEEVFGQRFEIARGGDYMLDFTAKGVDKGFAAREIARLFDTDISLVAAIGDGYNDLPMIEVAGVGIATANAVGKLKDVADCVCENTNGSAVAEVVEKLFSGAISR